MMSDKIELIKERDRLFIKSQHLGQDKERLEEDNAELKKENENLSESIKGMASGKANLDKSYQELEKLYGRLEGENAELVKRWADLELYCRTNIAWYKDQDSYDKRCPGTYRDSCEALDDVLAEMEELQAGSK